MIVEVACVSLKSKDLSRKQNASLHDAPYDKRQATLRFTLTKGIRILSRMSKSSFQLLQDMEEPSLVYYIGRWRCLADYTKFRGSLERKDLMSALRCCEASLDWHDFSEAEYSQPRTVTSTLLHRPRDIFSSPLVGIARCHVGSSWKMGGGSALEWVSSSTGKHPTHKSLISKKPLIQFEKDVMLLSPSDADSKAVDKICTVIGEWKSGKPWEVLGANGRTRVRCSSVDLRIASPIHLYR
jgi:hypothetical protein